VTLTGHPTQWARALWAAAEPLTLSLIFSREARFAAKQLGLPAASTFIAVRGAVLGRASSAVVAASFHGFPHEVIAETWDGLWDDLSPQTLIDAHHAAIPLTAARTLPDAVDVVELRQWADRLTALVAGLDTAGRPLAAANQAVVAPTEPWARLWRAANTLREFRGDGHIAALVAADLDVTEALALTISWGGSQIDADLVRTSRRVDEQRWEAAVNRLADRGFLTASGALTPAGRVLREDVEQTTDRLTMRAWNGLTASECEDLYALLARLSAQLIEDENMRAVTAVGAPWPPPALLGAPAQ
jgi:hypothetical protein